MMHGQMWWMPLVMWGGFLLLLVLAAGVIVLLVRGDPSTATGQEIEPATTDGPAPAGPSGASSPPRTRPDPPGDADERRVYDLVLEDEVLQKDLPEATGFSKAKVSRVLDRLERKGLIVRVSHGMTNRIVPATAADHEQEDPEYPS